MGEYISCLMEYGELPSSGVENAELKKHSAGSGAGKTCDSKFDSFNLAAGRQAFTKTSNTPKSSVDAIVERNKNSSRGAETTSNKSGNESNKSDINNLSRSDRDKAKNSLYANGQIQRSSGAGASTTADNGSASADKVRIIAQDETDAERRARQAENSMRSNNRVIYERSRYKAIAGKELQDIEKQTKSERAPTSQILTTIDESGRMGPRKSMITRQELTVRQVATESEDQMNFGYFMKWLIIAAMIIAIVLFFGSQIMNFVNSQEK